ncbi:LysE family translocator [Actinoplanes sp. NPDC051494]|uniref:LysE family translocator n=1 Tax=Actinoplanes sp. NPDC051494 TaxID=3363907 RepID=UPI0037872D10
MPIHLTAFVVTTWLLAMLPGAGQALVVRQTLTGGRVAAAAAIAGTATGLLIWSTAAAAGLSAVLLANPAAYRMIRVSGGVVLVLLGVSTWWSLRRAAVAAGSGAGLTRRRGYLAGLATNLGNPKAGVFAVSLLPQFVTPDGPVLLSSIGLGVLWAAVTSTWYVLFTWLVDRGRSFTSRPAVRRRLQAVTGGVLILLGVAVAAGM